MFLELEDPGGSSTHRTLTSYDKSNPRRVVWLRCTASNKKKNNKISITVGVAYKNVPYFVFCDRRDEGQFRKNGFW